MKVGDYVWWVVFGNGYAGTILRIKGRSATIRQEVGVQQINGRDWTLPLTLIHHVEP